MSEAAGGPPDGSAAGPGRGPGDRAIAEADRRWLRRAIELAHRCPPSTSAFSVGAVVVDRDGHEIATGWSRRTDPKVHAEEAALASLPPADPRLATATIYSSLEPCRARLSRPRPCTELIVAAGIRRVVFAWREPALFVEGKGAGDLAAAGVEVVEVPELAEAARQVNAHLLP